MKPHQIRAAISAEHDELLGRIEELTGLLTRRGSGEPDLDAVVLERTLRLCGFLHRQERFEVATLAPALGRAAFPFLRRRRALRADLAQLLVTNGRAGHGMQLLAAGLPELLAELSAGSVDEAAAWLETRPVVVPAAVAPAHDAAASLSPA